MAATSSSTAERAAPTPRHAHARARRDVRLGPDDLAGLIDAAVQAIDEAPFLTAKQKRDIFYNNAARFLRLPNPDAAGAR